MKFEIEPSRMALDYGGQARSAWFVRLPEHMTTEDVATNSAAWRKVQHSPTPLRRHDRVYAVAWDESFAVDCVVTDATREAVSLSVGKVHKFAARTTPLFSDDRFRVVWAGDGFAVQRIADGVTLAGRHGSEALAVRAIRLLYPTRAA